MYYNQLYFCNLYVVVTALENSRKEKEILDKEIVKQQELLNETKETYEKLRKLLEQKSYSRRRRSKSNISYEMTKIITQVPVIVGGMKQEIYLISFMVDLSHLCMGLGISSLQMPVRK